MLVCVCCIQISKKRVDSFKPGRTVPSTKLEATLSESSWGYKVPKRSHLITLKGTKEPDNQIWIVLDPVDPNQGIVVSMYNQTLICVFSISSPSTSAQPHECSGNPRSAIWRLLSSTSPIATRYVYKSQ